MSLMPSLADLALALKGIKKNDLPNQYSKGTKGYSHNYLSCILASTYSGWLARLI